LGLSARKTVGAGRTTTGLVALVVVVAVAVAVAEIGTLAAVWAVTGVGLGGLVVVVPSSPATSTRQPTLLAWASPDVDTLP
jgi:hypothetical protein